MFIKYKLLFQFFLNEVYKFKSKLIFLINFIKEVSITKLIIFKFYKKNFPFRNSDLNEYLKKNIHIWKKYNFKTKDKILVDFTVERHPLYAIANCLISKEISKFEKQEIIGFIFKYDYLSYLIAYSFGIRKFIFFDYGNIFTRFKFFLKAINLISNNQLQKKIIKLKYKKFDLGKAVYEHTMRNFVKKIPSDKDNYLFYIALANGLYSVEFIKKIFNNFNISNLVLSELQYIPNRILFTQSLQKKILVYSRYTGHTGEPLTVRLYKNINHQNSFRIKISEKFVSYLKNKPYLKKKSNDFFLKSNFTKKMGIEEYFVDDGHVKKPRIIKFKNKIDFYNYFNLDKKKKNILILPHILIDNLFTTEWSLFESPLVWLLETLKKIKYIDNVNWIIKPHPSESVFIESKQGLSVKKIFNKLNIRKPNVKLLENGVVIKNIEKYISCVLTSHGSSGYEYTALGKPVINTADAYYSNFNLTLQPKSKKQYFNFIHNLNKIHKVDKKKIFLAKLFWYTYRKAIRSKHSLLPLFDPHEEFNKSEFWKLANRINKTKSYSNDEFCEYFRIQIKNKNRHTINFKSLGIKNYENFKLNDI